ncbi:CGLD27 family protein [Microcoleus sp. FACHB-831]|uniref:CGLD27 family protein n=1 Tax=Microcoleus sp. FACHB-831 TaxID=2692827 RepID=UPI001683D483|nr:CGLD27 family protein [Microcoleus sp. FACHB-831]MBD1923367.1 CGLD27 family protein [Microcoleus sp. FACHB-831]
MLESSVSVCPVPTEQQPLNEYEELKQSWFFSWATLSPQQYFTKLGWVWGWSWLVSGPIAAASFAPAKHLVQFVLCGAGGASVFMVLAVLRLYLGWSYVRDRLQCPTVFYEESGWYDGQTWTKPTEVLTRDRLIVTYQVQPILQRLVKTFGFLALCFSLGNILWFFL